MHIIAVGISRYSISETSLRRAFCAFFGAARTLRVSLRIYREKNGHSGRFTERKSAVDMSTPEDEIKFQSFLDWIEPDRNIQAEAYIRLHSHLIVHFASKGCHIPEDLADQTIVRVTGQMPGLPERYVGEAPGKYIYKVGKNLIRDYFSNGPVPMPPNAHFTDHQMLDVLDHCLNLLPPDKRNLVLKYHSKRGKAGIRMRQQMADKQGITINALRIRFNRISASLKKCINARRNKDD
jgi:DNA-directed RNA polymerase specialized sigma24 family protein